MGVSFLHANVLLFCKLFLIFCWFQKSQQCTITEVNIGNVGAMCGKGSITVDAVLSLDSAQTGGYVCPSLPFISFISFFFHFIFFFFIQTETTYVGDGLLASILLM